MSDTPAPAFKTVASVPASSTQNAQITPEQYTALINAVAAALGITLDPTKVTGFVTRKTPQGAVVQYQANA